jgi:hypothetical protein
MSLEEENLVLKYELHYSVDALSGLSPKSAKKVVYA